MADTRCANPDYQLDADILMVEYVVYKAIEAQLHLLEFLSATAQNAPTNGALDAGVHQAEEAVRLTETYDTLVRLFTTTHGFAKLRDVTQLDAYVLQFLMLLSTWVQARMKTFQGPASLMSREMQHNFQRDQLVNQFFRHFWLIKREHGTDDEACESINEHRNRNPQMCLADHILPHFMHLSYQLRLPNDRLTRTWMSLASTFMTHAAIEVLDAPDLLADGAEAAEQALKECFAWGYVKRSRFENNEVIARRLLDQIHSKGTHVRRSSMDECVEYIQSTAILEDSVSDMFMDEGSDQKRSANDDCSQPNEILEWTRLRHQALEAVLTTFATMQEESTSETRRPVEWLRNQYRLSGFLAEVAKFVSICWGNVHATERYGKPILLQIEEGGIHGLSSEELEAFMGRAGIGSDS